MAGLAARLLMALETLGQQIFLQTNTSQRIVLSSENVGKHHSVTSMKENNVANCSNSVTWDDRLAIFARLVLRVARVH